MKKVLLGTTALVAAGMIASSPALSAEKLSVKVGGYMEQWMGYASVDDNAGRDVDGFERQRGLEEHDVDSERAGTGGIVEFHSDHPSVSRARAAVVRGAFSVAGRSDRPP